MGLVKYRTGDEVVHIDNTSFNMRVRNLVYKDKKLQHITCSFFEDGKLKVNNFHSYELIPLSVAKKGQSYIDSFLKSSNIK